MTLPSTQAQLVRLAYGELPTLERLETEFAVSEHADLRVEYRALRQAKAELPRVSFSPSPAALAAVLAYSRGAGEA